MLMHDEYDAAGFTAPSPMEGHGAYNRSSHVQAAGLAAAIPLLRLAAETAPLAPAPEPIVIAITKRPSSRAISVVHTDLPSNDFSALFEALESDPDSYIRGASRRHSPLPSADRSTSNFSPPTA